MLIANSHKFFVPNTSSKLLTCPTTTPRQIPSEKNVAIVPRDINGAISARYVCL